MRSKLIKIPIYPGYLCLVDAEKLEDLKKFKMEHIFESNEQLFAHTIYHQFKGRICNFIIINTKHSEPITPGIIAHESLHVVSNVFMHIGNKFDTANDEDAAYLISWVVNEVHSFLYGKKAVNQ